MDDTRFMEKLDHMVKDFHLFEYNKGMETRKWSEDDKRRSKDFITAIEKRLQIRRIFRSLESFVGGRIRDIDYRLINRTTDKQLFIELSHSELVDIEQDTYPILLSSTHCGNKSILRVLRIILVILPEHPSETKVLHNEDGNPARANIKQALGRITQRWRWRWNFPVPEISSVKASANSDIVYFFTSAQDGDPLQDDDFQDSPDDEEDTRSSHEYLNDLEEEYQARALLAKSKRFFKKASKALTVKNKGLIIEAYEWYEEELSSDDNEMVKVKVLMALAEENDDVSKEGARNGEWVKISMRKCINKQIPSQKKRIIGVDQLTEDPSSSGQKDLVFVKSLADDTKVSIPAESQRNTTDPSVTVTDSSTTDYDSADESSVCSSPLPPLKKLDGAEPISGPKTIKSILRSKSTFKAETLKGVIINEPSSALTKDNKSSSASKVNSAPAGKLKSVKIKDDPPLAINIFIHHDMYHSSEKSVRSSSRSKIPRPSKCFFPPCTHCGSIDQLSNECLYYPICRLCGSYDHDTNGYNRIISLEREIDLRNLQHAFKRCEAYGSSTHTTTDHYDIEWFKRGEVLQAKKAEALKSTRAESSNANGSKTPTKRKPIWYLESGCSRHMTCVKSYMHKYVEQPGPKVVFGDDSTCTTKGYGSIKWTTSCKFCDEKRISQNFSSPYTPEQNGVSERKNRTLIEAARTMLSGSVFSKQYLTKAVATACYTQNRSTIVKRHLKTPYEIFRKRIPNINFLHVFGCPVYIYNHKDHLEKSDEKADDGYHFGYSLISKAFRVFNTRRQQTEETYHITFDESLDAIKSWSETTMFAPAIQQKSKVVVFFFPLRTTRFACSLPMSTSDDVSFIKPYESPKPVVNENEVSSYQNGQTDQNDQTDEILNDNLSEHSNHNNNE
ncbi:retrovirus-related pol polyprotein from transposon TNT 1-94 [Tanacetum coccineum]